MGSNNLAQEVIIWLLSENKILSAFCMQVTVWNHNGKICPLSVNQQFYIFGSCQASAAK